MESPVPYSRGLPKLSLSVMKQGRSGYDPSDTETELHEAPWNEFNKKVTEGLPPPRRHSLKFDPEGLPPPRRHSKSPYKTRRDGRKSRSPTPGPLPLPPGRTISPFSKSERRTHVSPFKLSRDDEQDAAGSYNNPKQRHLNNESEKPSYARAMSAPRLRSCDKDQQTKHNQRLKRREGRSRTPPSHRTITPQKDKESNHKNTPSVGEINEMVANAKLAKSPVRHAPVFDSTDSLPGGDIFFSRDYPPVPAPKPKLFMAKKPGPVRSYKPNGVHNYSGSVLTPTTMTSSSAVSRQSSHISDVSAKSNGSSWRFTANRQKSQTDSWFSCIGKGSCTTKKKSPERLRAFDEASFIEKAFVVENLRQFWADKYQPLSLNGFTCHKQEALQLKHLASQDMFPHILLKGPQGSGKKALTMALLCEIYGEAARNISHDIKYFKVQETRAGQVAAPITSSPHHVELNVHLEGNARYALMAMVKQISSDHAVTPGISLKFEFELTSFLLSYTQ
ncbi:uncharacterized protein LOC143535307 [Bidens hawaiensis]|uniref:uncharacterized protein LOC143535307 n=1 Tax=Bidens hawaiensis TaxID=980011 RepID=UPI00404B5535